MNMKMSLAISVILGITMLVSCTRVSPQSTTPAGEGFAIYLTANDVPVSQMDALSHVELVQTPIISVTDIVAYDWSKHEIQLTAEAAKRIDTLQVPPNGKSFVVCVDRQPVYWGAFWVAYSSLSFDGITIDTLFVSKSRTIRIAKGYPSASFFQGEDPRNDTRIKASLEESGKLVQAEEQADDVVYTPGGLAYRANVHEQGVPDKWPSIEMKEVTLGTEPDTVLIRYRQNIETKAGQTRNNLLHIALSGVTIGDPAFTFMTVNITSVAPPAGFSIQQDEVWYGANPGGISEVVVKIDISSQVKSGTYTLNLDLRINNKAYGTLPCEITVVE